MSEQNESPARFWAKVFIPWAIALYMVSMIVGQSLIQRALLPGWLAKIIDFFYAPLGWIISIVD